jgi:dihydrofolate reductase
MAALIYSAIASLDGYVEDSQGRFDWAEPDEEVFSAVNDLQRPVGTYLYGRRMYETMLSWEMAPSDENVPAHRRDFIQMWQAAEKLVYSRTLESVASARTRIERSFDPQSIRKLKRTVSRDVTVGGADLAGQAVDAGLVDEFQLFLAPVIVGGGTSWLPKGLRLSLELLEERRFASGSVLLRYRPKEGEVSSRG